MAEVWGALGKILIRELNTNRGTERCGKGSKGKARAVGKLQGWLEFARLQSGWECALWAGGVSRGLGVSPLPPPCLGTGWLLAPEGVGGVVCSALAPCLLGEVTWLPWLGY